MNKQCQQPQPHPDRCGCVREIAEHNAQAYAEAIAALAAKDARIAELEKSRTEWVEAYWKTHHQSGHIKRSNHRGDSYAKQQAEPKGCTKPDCFPYCDCGTIDDYVPPATHSEDGREVPLAERMKAAGMIPAAELLAGAPLDAFVAHAGVIDLDTFGQWLVMKRKEYIDMQARFTLDKREDDELYEWVVAHCAVFGEVHINFRNARRAQTTRQPVEDGREVVTDIADLFADSKCVICGDTGHFIVDDTGPEYVTSPCPECNAPDAWRMFDGEGGYDYTHDEETAERWKKHCGEKYASWVEPLYLSAPTGSQHSRIVAVKDAELKELRDSMAFRTSLIGRLESEIEQLRAQSARQVGGDEWRCFHCDEHFTDKEQAALHFGTSLIHNPACQIDIAEYRAMESRMERYNEEDADIHRSMYRMQNEHNQALRREEEKGYARGLKDAALAPAARQVGDDRAQFEAWHNRFYGPQGEFNPIRSLEHHSEEIGLGYVDPVVQAQFVAFSAALAPAAVAPEQWEKKLARLHPNIEPGKWPASWRKDAIEQELREFRLNRRAIPLELLERIYNHLEHGEDIGPAADELRALLGKDGSQ